MNGNLKRRIDNIERSLNTTDELEDPSGYLDGKPVSCKELTEYLIEISRLQEK